MTSGTALAAGFPVPGVRVSTPHIVPLPSCHPQCRTAPSRTGVIPHRRKSIPKHTTGQSDHFDADYYRKYYHNPVTSVVTRAMQRHEVAFVIAFCRHIELEVKRFTDAGAGTGWWAREFARRYPSCLHIETFDASEAACRLYGHRRAELQKLGGRESDLVVCRDVLRYLNDTDAAKGIRRLARKCRGVLYLHAITSDDDIDEEGSDMAGFFRPVSWYRKRLRDAGFKDCGMGLFVSDKLKSFSPFAIESR